MRKALNWKKLTMMLIVLMLSIPYGQTLAEPAKSVRTNAAAAALIDVTSGRILYSAHGDEQMRIASLTKIMTAIVAIEHGRLSDKVTVSKRAFAKEGSSIYLKLGEEMSLEDMLYGLMLRSGNDAATAIAEHIGGSEEGFVLMMNQKAEMLGLHDSHFMNPHGLDAEGHYSSANDLAKLTAYALKNPIFRDIVKTKVKKAPNPNEKWDYSWLNKNKMLQMYDGADGVKTGYTKKALRCLVSSATRNGQQIVAVTLNDGSDWVDHQHLLDYGFQNYPLKDVMHKGQVIENYPFQLGKNFSYPFAEGEEEQLRTKVVITTQNSREYKLGERGKLYVMLGERQLGVIPLYEKESSLLQTRDRNVFANEQPTTAQVQYKGKITSFEEALISVFRAIFTANN
ncbi:D-alanyl-D-alanine carboxypeptidase [Paenibacillus selenitireducens]|uniref:D-alanyl-D-alanine carboxypeptidase n=2 Tax=Paenibacillus selenitireducens TaxID=1324314 RepID=A0A1T2XNK6_9BACL|nr:D-alanyl-D-alanine carboxypeptidase [Paenibacillus selenitireducens]